MGLNINQFEKIKDRARKLIKEDAKNDAHIIKARQADRNNPAFFSDQPTDAYSQVTSFGGASSQQVNESYADDDSRLFNAMDNKMKQFVENRQQQPQYTLQPPTQINKNLPKEILESFSSNYIDQSVFNPDMPVLDKIGITNGNTQIQQENYTPQIQSSGTKIDYELIKNIVESSVKKYMNALSKKMLTENNNLTMVQLGDKKINVVTKDGSVYSANLEFIKNIKK